MPIGSAIVDLFSVLLLWALSVGGGIAVLLSWIYVESEYDGEGLLTRGSLYSIRARALLTFGCMVFWICTFLGYALTDSRGLIFGFWLAHPVLLVTLFFFADLLLIISVVFAWRASGSGRWILRIASPVIAVVSIYASFVFFVSRLSSAPGF
jgi:hypothetical protein